MTPLIRRTTARGFQAVCTDCSGSLADAASMRQALGPETLDRIWYRIGRGKPADIDCPAFGEAMLATKVDGVVLDGCPSHDIIWFDGSELKRFRSGLHTPETSRLVTFVDGLV